MKAPLYCLPTLFQIFSNLPCHHQPSPPLLFLLSCFFDQMGDLTTFDVLFCLRILWIHTCQTLVRQYQKDLDVCFMQQGLRFTEVWHMWLIASTLIWYHKQTHRYTDWRTQINTYLHHLLCAYSSYLYYTEWIIHWYHKFTFHNVFSFKNFSLLKVINLLINCYSCCY